MKYSVYMRKAALMLCSFLAVFCVGMPSLAYAQAAPSPAPQSTTCDTDNCKHITDRFIEFVNLLSALVGVAVIGSIIWGGIEYITAADNAQRLSGAKTRIRNALIALIAFFLLYAFLQWLVPGGIF